MLVEYRGDAYRMMVVGERTMAKTGFIWRQRRYGKGGVVYVCVCVYMCVCVRACVRSGECVCGGGYCDTFSVIELVLFFNPQWLGERANNFRSLKFLEGSKL